VPNSESILRAFRVHLVWLAGSSHFSAPRSNQFSIVYIILFLHMRHSRQWRHLITAGNRVLKDRSKQKVHFRRVFLASAAIHYGLHWCEWLRSGTRAVGRSALRLRWAYCSRARGEGQLLNDRSTVLFPWECFTEASICNVECFYM